VSNYPRAFAAYLTPSLITPVSELKLRELACSSGPHFLLFQFGEETPSLKACLADRRAFPLYSSTVATNIGSVSTAVLDVPGRH
jgi:hypothetical protein